MDMKDKYLGIWVTRAELETIFSLEPVSTAARFLVAGTVVGEAPSGGLWMESDTVSTLGERDIFPDAAKERPCRLIRWDLLIRGFHYEGWDPTAKPLRERHREQFLERISRELGPGDAVDPEVAARAVFALLARHVADGEIEDVKHVLPSELRALWP